MKGVFLDIETSGLDPFSHVVFEIAFQIIDLHTGAVLNELDHVVYHEKKIFDQADPVSLHINGFTYDQISSGVPMEEIQSKILGSFAQYDIVRRKAVFICQNPSFDRGFFAHIVPVAIQEKKQFPYHWLDLASMYFALRAQKEGIVEEGNYSKNHIAREYGLPDEKNPHNAKRGVEHLIACYEKVVGWHPLGILETP